MVTARKTCHHSPMFDIGLPISSMHVAGAAWRRSGQPRSNIPYLRNHLTIKEKLKQLKQTNNEL